MSTAFTTAKMLFVLAQIVRDPNRLDKVFALVDNVAGDPKNAAQLEPLLRQPQVAEAAAARRRTPPLTFESLEAMPEGSVGRIAARFFRAHGLDPAAMPRRETPTDVEWVSAHLYETHDLWHVLTGFGPDVAGELGLQAFYCAQVEGSVSIAIMSAGLLNTLLYRPDDRVPRMAAIARGWGLGVRAHALVGLDWAKTLERPLADVRRELGLSVDAADDAMSGFFISKLAA
jgi:ubiquinone biosynthesis protein Coq4